MSKFDVYIKCFDDEDDIEKVTKEPVSYHQAVAIDRGVEINLSEDYYTEIVEVRDWND